MNRKNLLQLAILALVSPLLIVRAQQGPTGILHGVVVREGISEPIRDASISVGTQFKATSDRDGRFTIEALPTGQYSITAQHEGYFAPDSSTPGSVLSRTTATIAAQQTTEVKLTLVPAGAVSGRIVGPDGRPLPDAIVEIMRVVYQGTGRALQTISQRQADDHGEYRLFNLPPGNYLIASMPRSASGPLGIVNGAQRREIVVRTFYPNVFESSNAAPVAIRLDDLKGIDIHLRTATGLRIAGRIISQLPTPATVAPAGIERQPNRSLLTIVPHNRNEFFDPRFSSTVAVSMEAPDNGAFQLGNVPPGLYDLYATLPDAPGYRPGTAAELAAQSVSIGRATVDVRGGDAAGVTIVIRQGTDVRGRLVIDGKPAAAAVRVSLQPADSSNGLAGFDKVGRFEPAIEPDGSFLIPVVPEATYRLQPVILHSDSVMTALPLLPPSAYVADIRQAGTSVYDNGIVINPGSSDPIEVVINTNGGTVSGTVARVGQQSVPQGTMVVLIPPEERRQNLALYRTALTNAQGAFTMTGVPPGPYKLFAWESIPAGAHQNAAFVKSHEEKGAAVLVPAGAAISRSVTLIPIEARQ